MKLEASLRQQLEKAKNQQTDPDVVNEEGFCMLWLDKWSINPYIINTYKWLLKRPVITAATFIIKKVPKSEQKIFPLKGSKKQIIFINKPIKSLTSEWQFQLFEDLFCEKNILVDKKKIKKCK